MTEKMRTAELLPPGAGAGTAIAPALGEAEAFRAMLHMAVERGVPVETMERLQAMYERVADRNAAREYAQALSDFQAACPPIRKTAEAKVATKAGGSYSYTYAELDEIARTIRPILRDCGLSYSWDSELRENRVRATCTLRHINGHRETAAFEALLDERAGMSGPQKAASSLTYAKRQSLIQVLGLTTCEADDDARTKGAAPGFISETQAADLDALLGEVGADRARFLAHFKVASLLDLPAAEFSGAVKLLEAKRRAGGAK